MVMIRPREFRARSREVGGRCEEGKQKTDILTIVAEKCADVRLGKGARKDSAGRRSVTRGIADKEKLRQI